MYLDRKFGLSRSLSEITLLFVLSLDLDRTLAQQKAQRKAKSKVKVTHCCLCFFKSTPLSQPNKAGLNDRPNNCPSTKSFSDLNEIWCVGKGL